MWLNNDQWRIYDVNVEGVSLVKNYRTQFQEILFKKSPAELIEKVKEKNIKGEE
jgi:phospholipid transport system substrate-binding protein